MKKQGMKHLRRRQFSFRAQQLEIFPQSLQLGRTMLRLGERAEEVKILDAYLTFSILKPLDRVQSGRLDKECCCYLATTGSKTIIYVSASARRGAPRDPLLLLRAYTIIRSLAFVFPSC